MFSFLNAVLDLDNISLHRKNQNICVLFYNRIKFQKQFVRTTSNRGPQNPSIKTLDPKSGSTKPEPATHTSARRSNSRHVAYSITQGRCCTALQFYSSLFCITFLPSRTINVVTTTICNFNYIVIEIGFTLRERLCWADPLGIPKVARAMCCVRFCECLFSVVW